MENEYPFQQMILKLDIHMQKNNLYFTALTKNKIGHRSKCKR